MLFFDKLITLRLFKMYRGTVKWKFSMHQVQLQPLIKQCGCFQEVTTMFSYVLVFPYQQCTMYNNEIVGLWF